MKRVVQKLYSKKKHKPKPKQKTKKMKRYNGKKTILKLKQFGGRVDHSHSVL